METVLVLLVACLIASFGADLFIKPVVTHLKEVIYNRDKNSKKADLKDETLRVFPQYMGWLERTLYIIAFYLGLPEFIGLWLTLKVAGGWGMWNPSDYKDAHIGRARFVVFMIGSGLSLLVSVLVVLLAQWVIRRVTVF